MYVYGVWQVELQEGIHTVWGFMGGGQSVDTQLVESPEKEKQGKE